MRIKRLPSIKHWEVMLDICFKQAAVTTRPCHAARALEKLPKTTRTNHSIYEHRPGGFVYVSGPRDYHYSGMESRWASWVPRRRSSARTSLDAAPASSLGPEQGAHPPWPCLACYAGSKLSQPMDHAATILLVGCHHRSPTRHMLCTANSVPVPPHTGHKGAYLSMAILRSLRLTSGLLSSSSVGSQPESHSAASKGHAHDPLRRYRPRYDAPPPPMVCRRPSCESRRKPLPRTDWRPRLFQQDDRAVLCWQSSGCLSGVIVEVLHTIGGNR